MMTDTAYQRAFAEGALEARVSNHDKHLEAVNGSLAEISKALIATNKVLQTLVDQADTRETVLQEEAAKRASRGLARWSPYTKVFAVLAALSTAVSLAVTFITLLRG